MTQPLKESRNMIYLQCDKCGHGQDYEWQMDTGTYYNGGFITRQCPRCRFIDQKNALRPNRNHKHKKGIFIKAIDY